LGSASALGRRLPPRGSLTGREFVRLDDGRGDVNRNLSRLEG
jgi:hypothetical protein